MYTLSHKMKLFSNYISSYFVRLDDTDTIYMNLIELQLQRISFNIIEIIQSFRLFKVKRLFFMWHNKFFKYL